MLDQGRELASLEPVHNFFWCQYVGYKKLNEFDRKSWGFFLAP